MKRQKIMATIKSGKNSEEFEKNKIAFLSVIASSPARGKVVSMDLREDGHVTLVLEGSGPAIIDYLNPHCEYVSCSDKMECPTLCHVG